MSCARAASILLYRWAVCPEAAKDLCARRRLTDWLRGTLRSRVPSGRVKSDCGSASRQGQGCARNTSHTLLGGNICTFWALTWPKRPLTSCCSRLLVPVTITPFRIHRLDFVTCGAG